MKKKLFILDDDPDILDLLREFFSSEETEVFSDRDADSAINRIKAQQPDVALMDINLPKKSGMEVLKEINTANLRLPVIMMTGQVTTQNAIEAMKYGAYDYVTKPFDMAKLESLVDKAFQSSLLNRKIIYTSERVPAAVEESKTDIMIGSSLEMIEIWKMVGKIADSNASVLIQGESGTGKELLARTIYFHSKRENKPFLAINCAALPENLLESELFGHEKGAFTDAIARRIGKFEQCDGGTLFLDEIAELSPACQGKLLRILENQEFQRIGGDETIKVDVRIIAATNRSLVKAVREGRFRIDLFYRLKVISFFLPALRDRTEDIALLVDFYIKKYSLEYGKRPKGISPAAMQLLQAYPWRGNVRELKNVINSAAVFSSGDTLMPEDFTPLLQAATTLTSTDPAPPSDDCYAILKPLFEKISQKNRGSVHEMFIAETEKSLLRLAMEKFYSNQVHAAEFLGISRNTLRKKLKEFELA